MNAQRKSKPAPCLDGAGDSERGGRMTKRPKIELVPVEADSDTQRVLERLIKALEKQGFKIIRKDTE
jgi:hypothetical protein